MRHEGLQGAQGPSGSDETCDQTQDLVQDIGQRTEKAPHSRGFLMQSRNGAPTSQPPAPSPGTCSNSPTRCRSEEHTSELQSLMRISYAVFCLKKNKKNNTIHIQQQMTQTINTRSQLLKLIS